MLKLSRDYWRSLAAPTAPISKRNAIDAPLMLAPLSKRLQMRADKHTKQIPRIVLPHGTMMRFRATMPTQRTPNSTSRFLNFMTNS